MASASRRAGITVLSWNINGLKEKFKKQETKAALLEIFDRYDVVLLQETHIGPMDNGKDWEIITNALSEKYTLVKLEDQTYRGRSVSPQKTMYMTYFSSEEEEVVEKKEKEEEEEKKKGRMYMTYFKPKSKGVAIIINKPHTLLRAYSEGGEYAWVYVEIGDQKYTFVSVYYHKDDPDLICNLMLKIIYSFLTDGSGAFKHRPVIGGDFNTTLDPRLDSNRVINGHAARRERLKEFMSIVKLSDVWREKHDGARTYTYVDKKNPENEPKNESESESESEPESKPTMSRLDYVFMLENDVKYVTSCEILKNITLSDHFPVSLTLKYPNND